mgnify:CR=1 FL=1
MSESVEMYLKTIFELSNEDDPVAISSVAKRLGVSSVSANEMIKRLVDQDAVTHTPYKGVALTDSGMRRACSVLRRHRLWERFLVDHLGIPWAAAHDPACQMEHATTEEVAEALAEYLGNPLTCPHGNEIPDREGVLVLAAATPLSEMTVGQKGHVARIYPEETTLLEYLGERAVLPGKAVLLDDIAPYNGPLTVRVENTPVVLGRTVAAHIYVMLEQAQP